MHGATYDEIRAVHVPADRDQHVSIGVLHRPSDPSVACESEIVGASRGCVYNISTFCSQRSLKAAIYRDRLSCLSVIKHRSYRYQYPRVIEQIIMTLASLVYSE